MNASNSITPCNTAKLEANDFLDSLESEHRSWLAAFADGHLGNFDKLRNNDYEAAMTEAAVRRFLQEHGIAVEPFEDLNGGEKRPDFFCAVAGYRFFVEVTCVSIQKAIQVTDLPHPHNRGFRGFQSLNNALWAACKGKVEQCANREYPTLVAIGTHHTMASMICTHETIIQELLTGETQLTWTVDSRTGEEVGGSYATTDLFSSTFIRRNSTGRISVARQPVSGLLICGFGICPPRILGVLHPLPVRAFDNRILPSVRFCEVSIDPTTDALTTHWSNDAAST